MEEFLVAHRQTVTKSKAYLIPVLLDDLDPHLLARHPELEMYTRTHTYIDARGIHDHNLTDLAMAKAIHAIRKRIR